MNVHAPKPNKYKAYRERKKAAGLKQVRVWTLDPDAPGFREAMRAAFERERGNAEIQELNDWCEADAGDVWGRFP